MILLQNFLTTTTVAHGSQPTAHFHFLKVLDPPMNILIHADLVEKPPVNEAPSNLAIFGRYLLTPKVMEILPDLQPGRRLELYNEWTPLFWRAQDEGLLVESPETFGWGWRFADERTGEVVAVARALVNEAPERTASLGADVLEALASVRLSEEDPEARRAAYMRLRAQVASGSFGRQQAPVG